MALVPMTFARCSTTQCLGASRAPPEKRATVLQKWCNGSGVSQDVDPALGRAAVLHLCLRCGRGWHQSGAAGGPQ
eukprot:6455902-Lingulodinium_polyedra.AAC.1